VLINVEIAVALKSKAAPVAAPTAKKIKTVLAIAIAAAAKHGLDLLLGCFSLARTAISSQSFGNVSCGRDLGTRSPWR
jgi:hypothetical protein